jgi:hypothetical protein
MTFMSPGSHSGPHQRAKRELYEDGHGGQGRGGFLK